MLSRMVLRRPYCASPRACSHALANIALNGYGLLHSGPAAQLCCYPVPRRQEDLATAIAIGQLAEDTAFLASSWGVASTCFGKSSNRGPSTALSGIHCKPRQSQARLGPLPFTPGSRLRPATPPSLGRILARSAVAGRRRDVGVAPRQAAHREQHVRADIG